MEPRNLGTIGTDIALSLETGVIRLHGVTYTLDVFRALAARRAPGGSGSV